MVTELKPLSLHTGQIKRVETTQRRAVDNEVVRFGVINIDMPAANTEYPSGGWQLPRNCKWFNLHARDRTAIRISTVMDKVAGSSNPYFTLKAGSSWNEFDLNIQEDLILYFASAGTSKVIEILVGLREV